MVDAAEVVADVGIEHMVAAARALHAQRFQCLCRAPLRPKPIRRGAEVRLEDGLQHERRGHLRHSVSDRRNAERPLPAIGLRDVAPQNRLRTIRACAQCGAEFLQQALDAILLDGREGHPIDPRRAAVPFHPPPRLLEDVRPPDPIHQGVKASFRGSLGRDPESALQLAHVVDGRTPTGVIGTGPAGHALARPCVDQRDHRRDPSLPSRCSSRGSALLRSPRTPAAHDSLSPSAYTSRAALTRAAQTGLSCSVPLRARVLRPIPRRDLARVRLRTGARETWPSPRHDRLGSRVVNLTRLQASRDVAARVLAPSVEALDTPLGPPASRPMPGVCYSALRRLPRRDLHPLEMNSVKQTMTCPLRHDAPCPDSKPARRSISVAVGTLRRARCH